MQGFLTRYYPTLLLMILAFGFFTRVWRLDNPSGYMFDEVYHAVTAKLIAHNDPRAFEWWNPPPEEKTAVDWLHPPLAKYTQAASMLLLGETPLGWRFSSAIFGVLVIFATASLAYELFASRTLSLLAALLASLDGLLLTMSRIAMNDIHVTFFILLAFIFYVKYLRRTGAFSGVQERKRETTLSKYKYFWLSGVAGGLAAATKWSGVFALGIIGLTEGLRWLRVAAASLTAKNTSNKLPYRNLIRIFLALIFIPAIIYLFSYWQMFLQGKDFDHFKELINQTWLYQTRLTATHPGQSRPFDWFLNLKPVWFAVDYVSETSRGNIYAFGNPALIWLGATSVFAVLGFLIKKLVYRKHSDENLLPLFLLMAFYFSVWLPWVFSPRIMFFYHYTPAVPLLCIILAYWLKKIWKSSHPDLRLLTPAALILIFAAFLVWFPHWTNIPVPTNFIENVYFLISSWRYAS